MADGIPQPAELLEEDLMSLLTDAMTSCTPIRQTVSDDGYGGTVEDFAEDEPFDAAIVFDTSIQARQAEAAGVSSRYTVTTKREKVLKYHDVFRREADGKIFRVTSDGDDKYTPVSASLDMRQVTAEEWRLPNG